MTIDKNKNGQELTICVKGRLDTTTAPQLEKEIQENLQGLTKLVIDLKELEYISSAGLRVLLAAQKAMNKQGEMVVQNVDESVMEVFEVTGFSDILTIQ
jgi:anti-sigma B factor antagonist